MKHTLDAKHWCFLSIAVTLIHFIVSVVQLRVAWRACRLHVRTVLSLEAEANRTLSALTLRSVISAVWPRHEHCSSPVSADHT